jgi:methylglyoxal/glyoxal reductase
VLKIDSKIKLNNGVEIPLFGLGVYLTEPAETIEAVGHALKAGYRHIDTAFMYANEKEVGEAIRASGIPRKEIFVTTKLWNSDQGYDQALRAFEKSFKNLNLGCIDLFLIHWPVPGRRLESWKAMTTLLKDGRCRAIGVSNFMIPHLEELLRQSEVIPAVNQVEFSPYLYQKELMDYCHEKGIRLEAYSPLTRGVKFRDPRLSKMAEKYRRSPAQIMIRWALQHEVIVIPKSSNKIRIEANAKVFDFSISTEDMKVLDGFNEDLHTSWDPTGAP